jgi:hypothetical protein
MSKLSRVEEGSVALTEGRRKRLYDKFEEVLGVDNAEAMMELLPPVGWADVARQSDLDHLRVDLEARIEAGEQRMLAALHREIASIHQEIGAVRREIGSLTRSLMIWGTGLFTTLAGMAFTAGHLL